MDQVTAAAGPDQAQLGERAVQAWLDQAANDLKSRKLKEALANLQSAHAKLTKLSQSVNAVTLASRLDQLRTWYETAQMLPSGPHAERLQLLTFTRHTLSQRAFSNRFGVTKLLRVKIFCEELRIPARIEFDDHDPDAMHVQLLLGDAPVAVCRVWVHAAPNGARWFVLDRLATFKADSYTYRNRGLATRLIADLEAYLNAQVSELNASLLVVHFPVRKTDVMVRKALDRGFKFAISNEEVQRQAKPPGGAVPELLYAENDRLRVNTLQLYKPLASATEEMVKRDIEGLAQRCREVIAKVEDAQNRAEVAALKQQWGLQHSSQQQQQQQQIRQQQQQQAQQ